MKLKLLSLLLILGLMVNVGCTSSNDDEGADVETADAVDTELEEGAEGLDEAVVEEGSEESTEEVADESTEESDDFAGDEEVVADTGEEEEVIAEDGTAEESAPSTDVAASEELPEDSLEDAGSSEIVAEDGTGTEGTELADGSVSEAAPTEEGAFDSAASETPAAEAPADYASGDTSGYDAPKMIPVKKIAETPFQKNGVLVNTVYLARPGEDLASISQKIYGSDMSAQLAQANPNLSNGVKVGDKVYYNSPKRPQDAERMLTYYEDNGMAPASYVAKSGDNIRVVSKNLLGDQASWKEVWATNMAVDSKDELAEGTELKYWPDGSVAAPTMAAAPIEPAPVPETPQMPEPTPQAAVAANDPAAPQDDFALPDDMANSGAAAGTIAAEPPPPPPPPPAAPQKSVASNDEKDLTFMLSAGGLLLVGVGVLLGIIRKGRSRKMSMNTHTQI